MDKIEIVCGDIIEITKKYGVNAVVNCAKRTLMGGHGVDGAIHDAIDSINNEKNYFKSQIKAELDDGNIKYDNTIRCDYGKAVITKGYGLSDYVIHAVGPKWDGNDKEVGGMCSKGCLDKLKNCYKESLDFMINYGCKSIAIPVISSGSYRFNYSIAARIEFASICNYLIKLKKRDKERFEMLEKIYIVVFHERDKKCFDLLCDDFSDYVNKEKQLIYLPTSDSYKSYKKEVSYDKEKRNYFGIVKKIREFLVISDKIFFISYLLKKTFGDKTWEGRRLLIEIQSIIKIVIPIIFYIVSPYVMNKSIKVIMITLAIYLLLETLVYATKLLFLSDILNPSANSLRSIVLLFINYIEINFYFAYFYNWFGGTGRKIALFMALNNAENINNVSIIIGGVQKYIILYFSGIILVHFINNFRPRKFNIIQK